MQSVAFISEHASPLARLDYKIDVFTRRDHPAQPVVADWCSGVRITRVNARSERVLAEEQLPPYMAQFGQSMLRFIRANRCCYALAHANFFMSGMASWQLKQCIRLPYVITFHALEYVCWLAQGQADGFPDVCFAIEQGLIRDADCVITECEQDASDMQTLSGNVCRRRAYRHFTWRRVARQVAALDRSVPMRQRYARLSCPLAAGNATARV